jgi:hypothetical protein
MRHIQKRNEPQSLTQWRAAFQNDPNFGYLLIEANLRREIRQALVSKVGRAYTGRRMDRASCLNTQSRGLHERRDASFANMLCMRADAACRARTARTSSWPDAGKRCFVSLATRREGSSLLR